MLEKRRNWVAFGQMRVENVGWGDGVWGGFGGGSGSWFAGVGIGDGVWEEEWKCGGVNCWW